MLQDFLSFNRPISPHLTIYAPQQSSIFSIWHRISGVLILFCSFLFLISFNNLILCTTQNLWFEIYSILQFKLNRIILLLFIMILFYHISNGLKHILWSLGFLLTKNFFIYFTFFVVFIFLIILLNL